MSSPNPCPECGRKTHWQHDWECQNPDCSLGNPPVDIRRKKK